MHPVTRQTPDACLADGRRLCLVEHSPLFRLASHDLTHCRNCDAAVAAGD